MPNHAFAVHLMFGLNGILYATWVTRIPAVKSAAALTDSRLGLALLAMGFGTFVGLPLAARLLASFSGMRLSALAGLASCAALLGVAASVAHGFAPLVAALLFFGASIACMDVAMNTRAAALEKQAGRSIMSSMHAAWSVGALAAALISAAAAQSQLAAPLQFAGVALLIGAGVLPFSAERAPAASARRASLAWPSGALLRIGLIAAAGAVVEGGMAEWSGVFLTEHRGASPGLAAAGYGGFALAMLAGRLSGDRVIDRWGRSRALRAGAGLAALGLALALATPDAAWAITALVAAGLGVSLVFPIAFGMAGRLGGASSGSAIAAVATMAYGSGMAGPPLIGFLSDAVSLPRALWLLVALCALIVVVGGAVDRR
jgi:predicted MFS family arabinose efflux permease